MTVTAVPGFVASGVACGIKADGAADLALVATEDGQPVTAAAVFTTNQAQAAPVLSTRAHLDASGGRAVAVIVNSGCANAATGDAGRDDAEEMCALVAAHLGCGVEEVLVCSTGLIGYRLPMDALRSGAGPLVSSRSAEGGPEAAMAILTTDTVPKEIALVGRDGEREFTVAGMAKGAAMLAPNMATMLAVLTTDALIEPSVLKAILVDAVSGSFNRLLIDGATSTNDTVIVLANGRAGPVVPAVLRATLEQACTRLAWMMATDAEGATRVATVRVRGAASDAEARQAARAVADSQLVQCSLHGGDPYWGRVVSELGSAGVSFDPDLVSVAYGNHVVAAHGIAAPHDVDAVAAHMAGSQVEITADLGLGEGDASVWTTDLGPGYIEENMRTS